MRRQRKNTGRCGSGGAGKNDGAAEAANGGGGDVVREQTTGWTTLIVGLLVTGFLFWANSNPAWASPFERYYLVNIGMLLWVPLTVIVLFLRRSPEDFALTPGDVRGGLLAALVLFVCFLPVIFATAPTPPFQNYYVNALLRAPQGSGALDYAGRLDVPRFVFHQGVFGFYMFAWEWYFRGFLLYGLRRIMPTTFAVLIQAAAFALLHYHKPLIEVVSSFFGAVVMAGLALRFRSFLPCFLLHWAISATFDGVVLNHFLHAAPGARP